MSDVLPLIARVRQNQPRPRVEDIAGTVRQSILNSRIRDRVPAGGRIAVGVGSRGIHCIQTVARTTVDTLKELGYRPFIKAAMGSHGGATPEGQRELLAGYGITPETMGVEVLTSLETLVLGTSPIGLPIYFDKDAYEADGIICLNRIKPHTDFRASYESGILKMMVIGFGKQRGAEQIHKLGLRGMKEVLPAVGKFLLENTKFSLGLAILENVDDQPAEIVPLEPEEVLTREPLLLDKVRTLMGRLPFDQIDVLVVGEIGKNYSGAGMDPNVIGRLMVETQPDFDKPLVTRLVVLDVSDESHGNIVGVGFADLCTQRLVDKIDPTPFHINVITSCFLERARVPITLPTDTAVLETAVQTSWRIDPKDVRMVVIPNSLELSTLYVSQAMASDVDSNPDLSFETGFTPVPLDESGFMEQEKLFPESVRGRRHKSVSVHH
ncbi:MAG: lactate racemase domain-containing protein [bacterium]